MSKTTYNPELDIEKGFNAEPINEGKPVTQAQRDAAEKAVADLIQKTRDELGK
jgi:hypothetical protein